MGHQVTDDAIIDIDSKSHHPIWRGNDAKFIRLLGYVRGVVLHIITHMGFPPLSCKIAIFSIHNIRMYTYIHHTCVWYRPDAIQHRTGSRPVLICCGLVTVIYQVLRPMYSSHQFQISPKMIILNTNGSDDEYAPNEWYVIVWANGDIMSLNSS